MSEQEEQALTGYYHMTPEDENALTYDAVPMVDLSVVYSPVLPHQWSREPVEVMPTVGGKYLLRYGRTQNLRGELTNTIAAEVVNEEWLRLMRARYLIRRDYYSLYFDCLPLVYYERDALLHSYFQGALYQLPEKLLHKSRRGWRLHLEVVRNTMPPDKYTVEGQLRELQSLIAQKQHE